MWFRKMLNLSEFRHLVLQDDEIFLLRVFFAIKVYRSTKLKKRLDHLDICTGDAMIKTVFFCFNP